MKPIWSSGRCRSNVLYIQILNLISKGVLRATLRTLCFVLADDLHVNILKFVAVDGTIVQPASINIVFGTKKHSNIVEYINWVLSELSAGEHKMLNRIVRTCISFLQ